MWTAGFFCAGFVLWMQDVFLFYDILCRMRLFHALSDERDILAVALGCHPVERNEPERGAVDAVAQSSALLRPAWEHMAEM